MRLKQNCLICNCKKFNKRISVSRRYSYLVCDICGVGVLDPIPTKREIKKSYNSENYFRNLSSKVNNSLFQWFLSRRVYQTPAEWIKSNFKVGSILDVGCGNGEFLNELKENGWDVFGIDISKIAIKNTSEKIGKENTKAGNFLSLKFISKYDIVSFWHVLEHTDYPILYLRRAKSLLKRGGFITGEVPNIASPLLKFYSSYYNWIIVPEHIFYFSEKSLKTLFKNAGFNYVKVLFPARGLLNFSFSFKNFLSENRVPSLITKTLFIFSIPFSILLGLIFVLLRKGEVIRFYARK